MRRWRWLNGMPDRAHPRVERYVEAVRALRALLTAEQTEGPTQARTAAILEARAAARTARGALNGTLSGQADRALKNVDFLNSP